MAAKNEFEIEILEDGTISVTTDGFDGTVHKSADEFVKTLGDMLGGPVVIKKRKRHHHHSHGERNRNQAKARG